MYSCIACKCHRPQLEIRISFLLMACLQMFGVFCSCSYCSTLCISHSRKPSSYWCDVMNITQTVKYLLVLHTFQRPKNQVRALILEVTLSSFYLCSGKIFICSLASKVFIIIWVRSLCACLCSQSYISFRIIFY